MTLIRALHASALLLSKNGIEDSLTEARLLLGCATNLSQVQIYTQPQQALSTDEKDRLDELLARRLKREPSAYILNHKEFYGIDRVAPELLQDELGVLAIALVRLAP